MKRTIRSCVPAALLLLLAWPIFGSLRPAKWGRFYVYGMGTVNWFRLEAWGSEKGTAFTPLVGVGYRLLDAEKADLLYINLSADVSQMKLRFPATSGPGALTINIMAETEVRFGPRGHRSPFSAYMGIGGGWTHLSYRTDWGDFIGAVDATPTDFAFELGFRHAALPSRKLLLRCGVRFHIKPVGSGEDDWYYSDYGGSARASTGMAQNRGAQTAEEKPVEILKGIDSYKNTQFLLGLQYHF